MINSYSARMRMVQCAAALSAVSALSACSGPGAFQNNQDFDKRIYAGAGGLLSRVDPDTSDVAGVSVDDSLSGGGSVFLGYDLNNRFAVEGHYADLGEAELSPAGNISYQVGGLSGLIYGFNRQRKSVETRGAVSFWSIWCGCPG